MDSEVTRRLLDACNDPYDEVKISAAYALGESGCRTEEVLRTLMQLSYSSDLDLRIAGLKALGRIYRN